MKEKSNKKNNSYISMIFCFLLAIGFIWLVTFFIQRFYFNPPALQDTLKATTLGQLGDFIGGILNPIFGFLTVIFLLWSIFIQRAELTLTRNELEKSAKALNKQVQLNRHVYNRKQLNDYISDLISRYEQLLEKKLPDMPCTYNEYGNASEMICTNIIQIINLAKSNVDNLKTPIPSFMKLEAYSDKTRIKILLNEMIYVITKISELTTDLLNITSLKSIKEQLYNKANNILEISVLIGLLNQIDSNKLHLQMANDWHNEITLSSEEC